MATTYYRTIDVLQEPFDMGVDASGRARVGFNIAVVKDASDTFIQEIMTTLQTAGVGTVNTNIFASSMAKIPTDVGPYLSVIEYQGVAPERTQNQIEPPAYQRPRAQIVVRSTNYIAARTMAYLAYHALQGVRNAELTV